MFQCRPTRGSEILDKDGSGPGSENEKLKVFADVDVNELDDLIQTLKNTFFHSDVTNEGHYLACHRHIGNEVKICGYKLKKIKRRKEVQFEDLEQNIASVTAIAVSQAGAEKLGDVVGVVSVGFSHASSCNNNRPSVFPQSETLMNIDESTTATYLGNFGEIPINEALITDVPLLDARLPNTHKKERSHMPPVVYEGNTPTQTTHFSKRLSQDESDSTGRDQCWKKIKHNGSYDSHESVSGPDLMEVASTAKMGEGTTYVSCNKVNATLDSDICKPPLAFMSVFNGKKAYNTPNITGELFSNAILKEDEKVRAASSIEQSLLNTKKEIKELRRKTQGDPQDYDTCNNLGDWSFQLHRVASSQARISPSIDEADDWIILSLPKCSSRDRVFLSDSATLLPPFEALVLGFIPFRMEDPKTGVSTDDMFFVLAGLPYSMIALKLPKVIPRMFSTLAENFESAASEAVD
ncbi:hypothetical protein FXO38_11669 [Capsicum annuum]|uniref:Uncharacterized protein n=1 Tax=Capsicum annuum TaxID=4072 RepID=A0A2G2YXF2_CAPAN|nr:hypothetical protein FXO38_11669 [Capsicum annuum]PHT74432.1 hypothetical protein T459_21709 [Capsicum annuum]